MLHSEELLDHFRNPRNAGELAPPAINVEVTNPVCGDTLRLFALWREDRVAECRYKSRGCVAAIACGSALTDLMLGRSREELRRLKAADIEAAVGGLPVESRHAAALCIDAVRALLG